MNVHEQLIELGFQLYNTGGGCEAFEKTLPSGEYLLVTDREGLEVPGENALIVVVGFYDAESDPIMPAVLVYTGRDLRDFVRFIEERGAE